MTIDGRTRLRIRQWFVEQMADEELADAIMESMPPVDWSELATRQDLALTTPTMVLILIGFALSVWVSLPVA